MTRPQPVDVWRDAIAQYVAHRLHPWTRASENPILDPADYAECYAWADDILALAADTAAHR